MFLSIIHILNPPSGFLVVLLLFLTEWLLHLSQTCELTESSHLQCVFRRSLLPFNGSFSLLKPHSTLMKFHVNMCNFLKIIQG